MDRLDPEKKRQEFLVRYSGMPDWQLERLAHEWESLTNPARLALKQEMERRGMQVEFEGESASDNSSEGDELSSSEDSSYPGEFIALWEFGFPGEAMVVQGFLESAGIKTLLVDGLNLPLHTMLLPHACPIRLQVLKGDAERAIEILASKSPDNPGSE
jgi:hypothetical protein